MDQEWLVAVALLGGLSLAQELGYRAGRRAKAEPGGTGGGQIGAVQAAMLGLLGLLLGFSFAGASSRFLERQDLITREANAIGTAYLRADTLDAPDRAALQRALQHYTQQRLEASKGTQFSVDSSALAEAERLQGEIWKAARQGTLAKPSAMLVVLPPVNEVIDMHSLRVAAGRRHLPALVVGLLIACSLMGMAVTGYGAGLAGRRRALLYSGLALLIGIALWITIDLDHPRAGLIQLSDAPLEALKFEAPPPTP